jgi:hypothetical protein
VQDVRKWEYLIPLRRRVRSLKTVPSPREDGHPYGLEALDFDPKIV